ncbi:hypothetical protein [Streptomyces bikiniensis]|uniref:hypothetical protein n=1 Tax=Streptomyces bikiniensis TaxID=1896 RepID=UPI00131A4AF9|nr:hypothetical protein [Streptomyces bikiniensis]
MTGAGGTGETGMSANSASFETGCGSDMSSPLSFTPACCHALIHTSNEQSCVRALPVGR